MTDLCAPFEPAAAFLEITMNRNHPLCVLTIVALAIAVWHSSGSRTEVHGDDISRVLKEVRSSQKRAEELNREFAAARKRSQELLQGVSDLAIAFSAWKEDLLRFMAEYRQMEDGRRVPKTADR